MLDLAPRQLAQPRAPTSPSVYPAEGAAPRPRGDADRLRPAGADPRSTRPRSGCSTGTASRSCCPRARAAAARSCTTWAARHEQPRLRPAQHRRLDARDRGRGARRHRHHRIGLRHDGQGLWLHVPQRSRPMRRRPSACPALAKDITEYVSEPRACAAIARDGRRRGLSLGLLDAARAEDHGPTQAAAEGGGLRREGRAGGPYLLRLGRHLQHAAAGDRRRSCASARSRISKRPGPRSSPPAISAA